VKIGFVCFRLDEQAVGGAETYISALAATLARRGHDVRLMASTAGGIAQPDRWRAFWTARFPAGSGRYQAGGLGVEPLELPCERLALPWRQPPARWARRLQQASEAEAVETLDFLAPNASAYLEDARRAWGEGPWVKLAPGWHPPEFSPGGVGRWTSPQFGVWASAGGRENVVLRLEGSAPQTATVQGDGVSRLSPGWFRLEAPVSPERGLSRFQTISFQPRGEARKLGLYINSATLVDTTSGETLASADLGETFSNAELGAWPGEDPAAFLSRRPMPAWLGSWFDAARGPNCRSVKRAVRRLASECDLVVFAGLPFATVGWSRWVQGRVATAIFPFRHAEDPYYAWEHYFQTMRAASGVLLLTRAEGRGLEAGKNLHYIGGGFGGEAVGAFPSMAERRAARQRLQVGEAGPVLAMLGRKTPGKGWRLVQEAVRLLRAQGHPSARLLLAGPDEDQASVDADATLYLGKISEEAKADLYRAADMFAFFSQSESFGLAILEAWAGGCPALVGDRCGSVAEVAQTLGAPVCASRPEAIAQAVAAFLDRPEEARARSWREGVARLRGEYSWEAVAERFESFAQTMKSR
jgi:hypothetical protein